MSLTRANPFNRPSPFKISSYGENYSGTSFSPSPAIIQSQVKPISSGFTTLGNNRPNSYSPSPTSLGVGYRNYQEIGTETNKNSYLNTMIPTTDNLGTKDKNIYSYGSSYTTNLNMNSNYSLLQANNPLSRENPFNRPSLLGNNIGTNRAGIGQDDHNRPSSSFNAVSNLYDIPDKYSNSISNNYDHLSYKYKPSGNFSTSRVGGIERIESTSRLDNFGTDLYKYDTKSPNKYGNTNLNLNLNTNYNLNSDKSETASVRSYINKINDLEEGKEEYQNYYSIENSSSLNNPFNRKSLNPTTKTNQNKYGNDYTSDKLTGPKDYSHLEYKGSHVEEKQRKKYGYHDQQQLKYPYGLDKYKYKYDQQKKIEENNKKNTLKTKDQYQYKTENNLNYEKYAYNYAQDIIGSKNFNKEEKNSQQFKGVIQNSIYNTLRTINPDRVPQDNNIKHRKPYQFEDYHQNQMDSQEDSQSQASSRYRNPYQNPQNRGRQIVNNNNNRDIGSSDPYKKYNFDKKQSYEYELQRVTLNQIVKNNKQFDTNYADNFNNHTNHYQSPQFQYQKTQLQYKKNQPVQLNQYQSPQFGTLNRKQPEINSLPKRDVNINVRNDNRMPHNNVGNKDIVRFEQENDDQESYGEYSNRSSRHETKEAPTYEQRKKQSGQYSSSFVFRNQQFCRLQMV